MESFQENLKKIAVNNFDDKRNFINILEPVPWT